MSAVILPFTAMTDFPNRINEHRRARGLSQQALGDIIGCSKMHVSGLERGTRELTVYWMRKIAEAFSITAADILSDEDNPMRLSPEEEAYVSRYRQADEPTRENLDKVSEALTGFRAEPDKQAAR